MQQIVINHNHVTQYNSIPQTYIDAVKCMLFNPTGESHSAGYTNGATLLYNADSRFVCSCTDTSTAPGAYTDTALRVARAHRNSYENWSQTGETHWYTNSSGIAEMKSHITYCENNSRHIACMLFGWCWDMTQTNTLTSDAETTDAPFYGCHWSGSCVGGPEGNLCWGLDSGDTALTDNSVCMDTYLSATQEYITYCTAQGYTTKIAFSTGPVDGGANAEDRYQRHLKHEHIRNYVAADTTRILFDYADILAWSNAGEENLPTWNGHAYQYIHSDNTLDLGGGAGNGDGDHIGERGALRLAKAFWVMLAKIAGWGERDARIVLGIRG